MSSHPQTVAGWAVNKAAARAEREKAIQDCVGDDQEARHCALCGEQITADTLSGFDEDGNLYCLGPHQIRMEHCTDAKI